MPTIQFDYAQTPGRATRRPPRWSPRSAKAGIKVKPNPIEAGQYYSIVFDPDKAGDLMCAGWGPDWPNASTVIPPLFTPAGGFDLSQVDDKAFNAKVNDAPRRTPTAPRSPSSGRR